MRSPDRRRRRTRARPGLEAGPIPLLRGDRSPPRATPAPPSLARTSRSTTPTSTPSATPPSRTASTSSSSDPKRRSPPDSSTPSTRAASSPSDPRKPPRRSSPPSGSPSRSCNPPACPTPAANSSRLAEAAHKWLEILGPDDLPVLKADGLAAGKGVIVPDHIDDAHAAIDEMFAGAFGSAGERVVIEDRLSGMEASAMAVVSGAPTSCRSR